MPLLVAWGGIELALFAGLILQSEPFRQVAFVSDTVTYTEVAEAIGRGHLIPTSRTLGYPLYLAACNLLGDGLRLAVLIQLLVNLTVAMGAWHLIARLVPEASMRLKGLVASLVFLAGLGMALLLLTDLLAGACLFAGLYGLLFWRGRAGLIASAAAVGAATLLRPTFTFLPLVLLPLALLVDRITTHVPRQLLVALACAGVAATALSIAVQYRADGYLGPSSVVAFNLETTLHHALAPTEPKDAYIRRFEEEMARRAGVPSATLSRSDRERWAKRLFMEAFARHPVAVSKELAVTASKYVIAPVEAVPASLARAGGWTDLYVRLVRPVLFVVWLPVWILALLPPWRGDRRRWAFYGFTLLLTAYCVGLSAIAPLQGERMRYPVVPFLMVLAGWQFHALIRRPSRAAPSSQPVHLP